MLRKTLLFALMIATLPSAFAQSLKIVNPVDEMTADYLKDAEAKMIIKNTSDQTINVKVKREIIELHPSHTNYFCWTYCYSPAVVTSPDTEVLMPGEENSKFVGYIGMDAQSLSDNLGQSVVRYCWFNADDESDQVCQTVTYNIVEPASLIVPEVPDYKMNNMIDYWSIYKKGDDFALDFKVYNYMDEPVDVIVKRKEVNKVDAHTNYFCWGSCFEPHVDESPIHQTLAVGGSQTFTTHLMIDPDIDAYENMGMTAYDFSFHNANDPTDSVVVPLVFDVSVPMSLGDQLETSGVALGLAYPNPAHNTVSFDYQNSLKSDARLELVNQLGQVQIEVPLSHESGKVVIPIDRYPAGVYFYRLNVAGITGNAKKLVIN